METRDGLALGLSEAKQLGSDLISSGKGSVAAIALAGIVTLFGAAVLGTRYEIKKHRSEKHLAKVKKVLELYKEYLVDIEGLGSFPSPFELGDQEHPKEAMALKLNRSIRNDLKEDKSINTDSFLDLYSHHIRNAKIELLGFYDARLNPDERNAFTRGNEDDVTSSVLTYLLVMLSEHFTKFEGLQTDIAYLGRFIRFINAYASLPRSSTLEMSDPKKRQRFERLKLVCRELRKARKILIDHNNSRTLKSFADELMSKTSKEQIPALSNLFTKIIVPENDWSFVDTATPELLAEGLVRPEYRNTHTLLSQKKLAIPDSIFKTWLQIVQAKYLSPEASILESIFLKEEHLAHIKILFYHCKNFLTLKSPQAKEDGNYDTDKFVSVGFDEECQFALLSQMPEVFEPDTFLLIKEGQSWKLYEIKADRCLVERPLEEVKGLSEALKVLPPNKPVENFSKKEKKAVNAALTAYRNHTQLNSRAQIFLDLALLLDQLIDLKFFCENLSNCIRDLGEIYMNNPHHCNFVFDSLSALGMNINIRIASILKSLEEVEDEQESANDMLIKEQLDLAEQFKRQLQAIREKISSNLNGIMDKHHNRSTLWGNLRAGGVINSEVYDKSKKKKAIQEMLVFATNVAIKYKIDTGKYQLNSSKVAFTSRSSVSLEVKEAESDGLLLDDLEEKSLSRPLPQAPQIAPDANLDSNGLLIKIRQRIDSLKQEEKPDQKTEQAYERFYNSLNELSLKAALMMRESNLLRQDKGRATEALTMDLCKKSLDFLQKDPSARLREAPFFLGDLQRELSAPSHHYLDEHRKNLGKVNRTAKEVGLCLIFGVGIYVANQRGGFFRTNSRVAAYRVGESCKNLVATLVFKV